MSEIEKLREEMQALQKQLRIVASILNHMQEVSVKRDSGEDTLLLQTEVIQELNFLDREQKG